MNIFNHDPEWKVEMRDQNNTITSFEQYWGKDPEVAKKYVYGQNKTHRWLGSAITRQLFVAPLSEGINKLSVTDRFGKVYTEELSIQN